MCTRWTSVLLILGTVLAGLVVRPAGLDAQGVPAGQTRVAPAPQSRATDQSGAALFARTCRVCHGEVGIGGVGPALRGARFTRAFVRRAMSEGTPGSMMPEFTRTFTASQMNEVAEYVASLQTPEGPAPVGLRGDPAAGEAVFFARGARSCYVCHTVGGRGGSVGPELGPALSARPAREIFQRIIVVPHRSSDPAYAPTRLTTKVAIYTGIVADSTDEVVHFYDTSTLPPMLRTIPKGEILDSVASDGSVMPSDYASRLTVQQLLDIVSFLKSPPGSPRVSVALTEVIQ